jgi:hypothetical protein
MERTPGEKVTDGADGTKEPYWGSNVPTWTRPGGSASLLFQPVERAARAAEVSSRTELAQEPSPATDIRMYAPLDSSVLAIARRPHPQRTHQFLAGPALGQEDGPTLRLLHVRLRRLHSEQQDRKRRQMGVRRAGGDGARGPQVLDHVPVEARFLQPGSRSFLARLPQPSPPAAPGAIMEPAGGGRCDTLGVS